MNIINTKLHEPFFYISKNLKKTAITYFESRYIDLIN